MASPIFQKTERPQKEIQPTIQKQIEIHSFLSKKEIGNTELVDSINSVLSKMTKDDYNKMMDEAISVQPLSK